MLMKRCIKLKKANTTNQEAHAITANKQIKTPSNPPRKNFKNPSFIINIVKNLSFREILHSIKQFITVFWRQIIR